MGNIKVSIITVCYNAENTIKETMLSVLKQNYSKIEYIIIDGCSTDNTKHIVDETKTDFENIIFVSEKDSGIYNAMNKGVRMATGEYIIFMNAGDFFCSKYVVSSLIEKSHNMDIIYGDHFFRRGNLSKLVRADIPDKIIKDSIFSHQAVMAKKTLLNNSPFDERFKLAADYKFFLMQYKENRSFMKINIPIVYYDCSGVSSNVIKTRKEHMNIRISEGVVTRNTEIIRYIIWYFKNVLREFIPRKIRNILYNDTVDYWFL